MQENHAIFIRKVRFLFVWTWEKGFCVCFSRFILIELLFSTFFLFTCQLRFVDRSLNRLSATSDGHLLTVDFDEFTVVLAQLFGEMLFATGHGLEKEDAFLMGFDYNFSRALK